MGYTPERGQKVHVHILNGHVERSWNPGIGPLWEVQIWYSIPFGGRWMEDVHTPIRLRTGDIPSFHTSIDGGVCIRILLLLEHL